MAPLAGTAAAASFDAVRVGLAAPISIDTVARSCTRYNPGPMGHLIELNDTLKLKRGAGFPVELRVGGVYDFSIAGRRLYNLKPTRVFLVEEIDGKWNVVGHALVLRQTIDAETDRTTGQFEVSQLYPPEYVRLVNQFDAPSGRGYSPDV